MTNDEETPVEAEVVSTVECVLVEGVPTKDGRLIEHGAIFWEAPNLPVMFRNEDPEAFRPMSQGAMMSDFHRDEDGRLLAYVTPPLPPGIRLAADLMFWEAEDGLDDDGNPTGTFTVKRAQLLLAAATEEENWNWDPKYLT
jgi:hypothetical protein